jgi:hypothetical protein
LDSPMALVVGGLDKGIMARNDENSSQTTNTCQRDGIFFMGTAEAIRRAL